MVNFGDTYINESKQLLFTLTNRSKTHCYRFEWPENSFINFSPRTGHLHADCAKDISVVFRPGEPKFIRKELISCLLVKIAFDQPSNETKDWDDRMNMVKWVNETVHTQNLNDRPGSSSQNISSITPAVNNMISKMSQIIRKKIIETEPEPRYNKVDETIQILELCISANSDYPKYKLSEHVIRFKDTLMFQTREYEYVFLNLFVLFSNVIKSKNFK